MERLLLIAAVLIVAPNRADAFCGFYVSGADGELFNNATQVVMMRKGTRTVLSMQNNYQGPAADFAMVVPVPMVLAKDNVKTLPHDIFKRIDRLSAPRLVEYWEQDPCRQNYPMKGDRRRMRSGAKAAKPTAESAAPDDLGVTIEAKFSRGEYEILILSAKDSGGLDTWLRARKYNIPKGASEALRPYVQTGMKFFVAKVNQKKVKKDANGRIVLSPLRFYYDFEDFTLPIRLGLLNSSGKQDLIVMLLSPNQRYHLKNYKNVTIPTNFDIKDDARKRFGEFYAALFDRTLERNPGAVVTEYAWQAQSCDPCPVGSLRMDELATFGMDVLDTPMATTAKPTAATSTTTASKKVDSMLAKGKPRMRRPPRRRWRPRTNMVLTRLHVRYDKKMMTEDLVFAQAPPIVGGREQRGADGTLENGSTPASFNNFQARYAIRHEWTGPMTCSNPVRGRWGGPPRGKNKPRPEAAADLAFAKRGELKLPTVVKRDVPEVGIVAASAKPATQSSGTGSIPKSDRPRKKKGCGCQGGSSGHDLGFVALFCLIVFASAMRRARR